MKDLKRPIQRCQPRKIKIRVTTNFGSRSTLLNHQNGVKPQKCINFLLKSVKLSIKTRILTHFPSNTGDLVTHTGDQEIRSVSGRLPDNQVELAWMPILTRREGVQIFNTIAQCTCKCNHAFRRTSLSVSIEKQCYGTHFFRQLVPLDFLWKHSLRDTIKYIF